MEQPSLFPDQPRPAQLSSEEMAAHIAENARPYEYVDRTNDAARDQGRGPVKGIPVPEALTPPRRQYEMSGRSRGRLNPYDQPATPAEVQRGMTTDEVDRQNAINKAGAAASRAALNRDKAS